MIVAVSGPLQWAAVEKITQSLDAIDPPVVVHGGAPGVDQVVAWWARERGREEHVRHGDEYPHDLVEVLRRRTILGEQVAVLACVRESATWTCELADLAEAAKIDVIRLRESA